MVRFRLSNRNLSLIFAFLIFLVGIINQHFRPLTSLIKEDIKAPPTTTTSHTKQQIKVVRVIDGDTIELENGQKIRYIGIDTPELHDPRKTVQCFAQEAYLKNKELVEGKIVRLEKDVSETDKYKRLLRFVYLNNQIGTSSALFVNDYLVREGYAHIVTVPPDVKFAEQFRQAQAEAMENNRGLWSKCNY